MDGWMDGWMVGWMDGWMDKQTTTDRERQTDIQVDGCLICSIYDARLSLYYSALFHSLPSDKWQQVFSTSKSWYPHARRHGVTT
jgi:hypothetical protein